MGKFSKKLEAGEFVWTTEIGPPKGISLDAVFKELECVKGKVDAVNVTDQQSAVMRMGSVAASKALLDAGYEPICQFTCRDRNRIALQSDIISAYVLGIRNILIMTGDHPLLGDHPQAKPVYDLDSVSFLKAVQTLQEGKDLSGKNLNAAPKFCSGAVVNPGADPLEPEIIKMEKKVACGARFFQTQAIFDADKFGEFIDKIGHLRSDIKILGGVFPLKSVKMAVYMNENIPGIFIPDSIIQRLERSSDIISESVLITADIIRQIKDLCDGIHFMPVRANNLVAEILGKVR